MTVAKPMTLSDLAEALMPLVHAQYRGRMTYAKRRQLETLTDSFFALDCPSTKAKLEPLRGHKKIPAAVLLQAVLTAREELGRAQTKASDETIKAIFQIIGSQPDLVTFCAQQAQALSTTDIDHPSARVALVVSSLLSDRQLKELQTKCANNTAAQAPDYQAEYEAEDKKLKAMEKSKPWSFGFKGIKRRVTNAMDTGYFFDHLLFKDPFADFEQKILGQRAITERARQKIAEQAAANLDIQQKNLSNDMAAKFLGQLLAQRINKIADLEQKRRLPPDAAQTIDRPTAMALARLQVDTPEIKSKFDGIINRQVSLSPENMIKFLRELERAAQSGSHTVILHQMQSWIVQSVDQPTLAAYDRAAKMERISHKSSIRNANREVRAIEAEKGVWNSLMNILGFGSSKFQQDYERRVPAKNKAYVLEMKNSAEAKEMAAIKKLLHAETGRRAAPAAAHYLHPANKPARRRISRPTIARAQRELALVLQA